MTEYAAKVQNMVPGLKMVSFVLYLPPDCVDFKPSGTMVSVWAMAFREGYARPILSSFPSLIYQERASVLSFTLEFRYHKDRARTTFFPTSFVA